MARIVAPVIALVVVTASVFGLAQWHPFSPSTTAAAGGGVTGDPERGARVFATSCAGCHGADATGGVGPSLRGSGLTAAEVEAVVAAGRGTMPAGVVTGQEAADVAAHVAAIAE